MTASTEAVSARHANAVSANKKWIIFVTVFMYFFLFCVNEPFAHGFTLREECQVEFCEGLTNLARA